MLKKTVLALSMALTTVLLSTAPTLAAHNLRIVNAGSHAVETINVSGINRRMWGPDLLGNNFLFPGQSANFTIREGCLEDVRVIYRNGHTLTRGSFNTCQYDLRLNY
ncbi:MAG TPA: hypothetical protein VMV82_01960 [Candidatus Dormibacteraeota bacterium]|nr:hypothetical protein [Candidatus Dormibacteraeota bacterium]